MESTKKAAGLWDRHCITILYNHCGGRQRTSAGMYRNRMWGREEYSRLCSFGSQLYGTGGSVPEPMWTSMCPPSPAPYPVLSQSTRFQLYDPGRHISKTTSYHNYIDSAGRKREGFAKTRPSCHLSAAFARGAGRCHLMECRWCCGQEKNIVQNHRRAAMRIQLPHHPRSAKSPAWWSSAVLFLVDLCRQASNSSALLCPKCH
jgi:hypothetical protein